MHFQYEQNNRLSRTCILQKQKLIASQINSETQPLLQKYGNCKSGTYITLQVLDSAGEGGMPSFTGERALRRAGVKMKKQVHMCIFRDVYVHMLKQEESE